MSDNDPEVTEGNASDGRNSKVPPREKGPETVSDIRGEVDQKPEGIEDLNDQDEGAGGDEMPPETGVSIREEVDQKLEDIFGDLDDDNDDDIDGVDETPAPPSDAPPGEPDRPSPEAVATDLSPTEPVTAALASATEDAPARDDAVPTVPESEVPEAAPAGAVKTAQAVDDDSEGRDPGDEGTGSDGDVEVSARPLDPVDPVKDKPGDPPPPDDTPVKTSRPAESDGEPTQAIAPPAEQKTRKPQTARILLWGVVLIIITVTVRYFVTYEFEEPTLTPAGKDGQLFHKVVSLPSPAASRPPAAQKAAWPTAVQKAPQPPAADKPPAAIPPTAAAPSDKPGPTVKAYVRRTYPYAIHVGSFRSSAVAGEKVAHYLKGFKAFMVRVDLVKKGVWYRVFLGHFPSATSAMDAIKKYHLTGALIRRTRYACLTGSYPSAAQAAAASQLLTDKAFFPYTITMGNGYHVFVGAHPTLAAAEALSKELSAKGFSSDLIER